MIEYRYRQARFQHDLYDGYWVTLYFIFDGERTYTFFSESDMVDNYMMMLESGIIAHNFAKDVLCTSTHLPELYRKIKEHVSSTRVY